MMICDGELIMNVIFVIIEIELSRKKKYFKYINIYKSKSNLFPPKENLHYERIIQKHKITIHKLNKLSRNFNCANYQ